MKKISFQIRAVCVLAILLVSCASDSEEGGYHDRFNATFISASRGGTVKSGSGKMRIVFPPGAVAKTTEVSIVSFDPEGMPQEDDIYGEVYVIGPPSLTLLKPVEIFIDAPDRGERLLEGTIVRLFNGFWMPIGTSGNWRDEISVESSYLGKIALIIIDHTGDPNWEPMYEIPDYCDIERIEDELAAGNWGAIGRNKEATILSLAEICIESEEPDEVCFGKVAHTAGQLLEVAEAISGSVIFVDPLLGKKRDFEALIDVGNLLDQIIDPIYLELGKLSESAEGMIASGCETDFNNGVTFNIGYSFGSGDIIMAGRWGELEARSLISISEIVRGFIDLVLAHSLEIEIDAYFDLTDFDLLSAEPFELMAAVGKFIEQSPGLLDLANGGELRLRLAAEGMAKGLNAIAPLFNKNSGLYKDRAGYLIEIEDGGAPGEIGEGDNLTINISSAYYILTILPYDAELQFKLVDCSVADFGWGRFCVDSGTAGDLRRLINRLAGSLSSTGGLDCTTAGKCFSTADLDVLNRLIDSPLGKITDLIRFDFGAFFAGGVPLRELLLVDDEFIIEGEYSGGVCPLEDCSSYIVGAGDLGHFPLEVTGAPEVISAIPADGVVPPGPDSVDNAGASHAEYVAPYYRPGDCRFGGSTYYNLAGLSGVESVWGDNYSIKADGSPEPDSWTAQTDADCLYNLNKIISIFMREIF